MGGLRGCHTGHAERPVKAPKSFLAFLQGPLGHNSAGICSLCSWRDGPCETMNCRPTPEICSQLCLFNPKQPQLSHFLQATCSQAYLCLHPLPLGWVLRMIHCQYCWTSGKKKEIHLIMGRGHLAFHLHVPSHPQPKK